MVSSDKNSSVSLPYEVTVLEKDLEAIKNHNYTDSSTEQWNDDWTTNPNNPLNWSRLRKWKIVTIVSLYSLVAPVSSSMMAPALPQIGEKYNVASVTLVNLSLTVFLLAFALGPLFTSPITEIAGRKWVLHVCHILLLIFTLACAFAPSIGSLIGLRFLAGLCSGAPLAIGGGVIADLFEPSERGSAMSFYILGLLFGPAIGPVIGGFVTQKIGFKWIFVIIAATTGVFAIFGLLGLEETFAPVIRAQDAARSLKAGTATEEDKVILASSDDASFERIMWINMSRPLSMLFTSLICFTFSFYMALTYGYYYLMFATFPTLFENIYGFSTGVAGLAYLGLGLASSFRRFLVVMSSMESIAESVFKSLLAVLSILCSFHLFLLQFVAKNGGVHKPEFRIPSMVVASFLVPIGLLWYGWSAQARIHWIMPIIGSGIFGLGMTGTQAPLLLYLVDSFQYAASATAAAAMLRSLFGFAFPLFGHQMYASLGFGPGNSLLAGLAVVFGIPFPIWIYYNGERLRQRSNLTR